MSLRLLLSRAARERLGPRLAQVLDGRPHEVVLLEDVREPHGQRIDVGLLSRDVTGKSTKFQLVPTTQRFFDTLYASPNLRWMHTHSAGTDRPVYPPLFERGVTITTSSGASARTIGVSVLGGMIALARGFVAQWEAQKRHDWQPLDEVAGPPEFARGRVLVVGLGPIGREISRLARAFGLHVTGVRRQPQPVAECDATASFAQLPGLLPQADWLVLACPLTTTTRNLIDATALARLPRGARLVNVARGEVVDEAAMARALAEGHLGGAWLDVFAHEPLDPASPLWDLPNVIISPHSSSRSSGHYDEVLEIFLDNLARWRDGAPLRNAARPGTD
jgi:phosphoglycerate dehydrogenase-like enzyme